MADDGVHKSMQEPKVEVNKAKRKAPAPKDESDSEMQVESSQNKMLEELLRISKENQLSVNQLVLHMGALESKVGAIEYKPPIGSVEQTCEIQLTVCPVVLFIRPYDTGTFGLFDNGSVGVLLVRAAVVPGLQDYVEAAQVGNCIGGQVLPVAALLTSVAGPASPFPRLPAPVRLSALAQPPSNRQQKPHAGSRCSTQSFAFVRCEELLTFPFQQDFWLLESAKREQDTRNPSKCLHCSP
ncbi:hypothetical protein MRX96_017497 [Rhipicephalus microplus]